MIEYRLVKVLSEGLLALVSDEHGRQLFTARKLRKARRCAVCKTEILKGETALGPLNGNAMNRAHRIHEICIENA